jgi:hypothetical protein
MNDRAAQIEKELYALLQASQRAGDYELEALVRTAYYAAQKVYDHTWKNMTWESTS